MADLMLPSEFRVMMSLYGSDLKAYMRDFLTRLKTGIGSELSFIFFSYGDCTAADLEGERPMAGKDSN